MASTYHAVNLPAPTLDDSESLVATNDYHTLLHSRQPLIRYEQRRRLLNTCIPNRGHVDRLPGVAALLRRHDSIQNSDPLLSVRDPSYELPRRSSTTESTFECWTPPSLTGRPSTITFPAFKMVPLTAALNPTGDRFSGWNPNFLKPPNQMLENWTEREKRSPPVLWSSEPDGSPRSKSSRYLREIDRRRILIRIAQGEKQSALAKEYHVSRAAICNLNKHRAQVLSRNHEHPLAKHPKRRMVTKVQSQDHDGELVFN